MPRGQAPSPKKKAVESGRADKAKAVRGGFERTNKTQMDRKVTHGGKGSATMTSTVSSKLPAGKKKKGK